MRKFGAHGGHIFPCAFRQLQQVQGHPNRLRFIASRPFRLSYLGSCNLDVVSALPTNVFSRGVAAATTDPAVESSRNER